MHRIGQEGQNNFLTDQMSRFWLGSGVRAPKVPKKGHFGTLSIDFAGQGGRSSKIPPNARWTPRSTTIAPGTMIRMLSATLGDVCDLG